MTGQITVTGMVLSAMPIGDYDKRLTILTIQKGKISAFARGARKPNSSLLGCSQPFSFGKFTLYEGRSSYTMASAEISNYFGELRTGMETVYYGLYFCEFAEYVTEEGNDSRAVLKLLYQSLRALSNETIGMVLVRLIFELKLLYLEGQGPQVLECIHCKETTELTGFSVKRGGMFCRKCIPCAGQIFSIRESTLYTLQFICVTPVEKLYCFIVKEEVLKELLLIVEACRREYVDKQMKSLEMIELLEHGGTVY